MTALHDMHCHLDFMANGTEVARAAAQDGTRLFANTVTPQGWEQASQRFQDCENVTVGFGMHPWWVEGAEAPLPQEAGEPGKRAGSQRSADRLRKEAAEHAAQADDAIARAQRQRVMELLAERNPRVIGEIGLDFGWQHVGTRAAQVRMLEAILAWAAREGGKLVSLHSVKAAAETLECLEQTGAAESCACIFHWFTGSSDLLKRAVDAGCYFSCGPRMLATKKGRAYVRAIPAAQLLLETDAPPTQGQPYPYTELRSHLESAAEGIAAIKGQDALDTIAATSAALLDTLPA